MQLRELTQDSYKGYTVDGYEANTGLDWRVLDNKGEWILSLPRKTDCKDWIETQTQEAT